MLRIVAALTWLRCAAGAAQPLARPLRGLPRSAPGRGRAPGRVPSRPPLPSSAPSSSSTSAAGPIASCFSRGAEPSSSRAGEQPTLDGNSSHAPSMGAVRPPQEVVAAALRRAREPRADPRRVRHRQDAARACPRRGERTEAHRARDPRVERPRHDDFGALRSRARRAVGGGHEARRPRRVRGRRHPHPRRDPQPVAPRPADPPRLLRVRNVPPAGLRGGRAQARARVRILAATNGDVRAAIKEQRFPAGPLLPPRRRHGRPAAAASAAGRRTGARRVDASKPYRFIADVDAVAGAPAAAARSSPGIAWSGNLRQLDHAVERARERKPSRARPRERRSSSPSTSHATRHRRRAAIQVEPSPPAQPLSTPGARWQQGVHSDRATLEELEKDVLRQAPDRGRRRRRICRARARDRADHPGESSRGARGSAPRRPRPPDALPGIVGSCRTTMTSSSWASGPRARGVHPRLRTMANESPASKRRASRAARRVHTGTLPSKTLREETALFLSGYRQRELYGLSVDLNPAAAIPKLLSRKNASRRSRGRARIKWNLERPPAASRSSARPRASSTRAHRRGDEQRRGAETRSRAKCSSSRPGSHPYTSPAGHPVRRRRRRRLPHHPADRSSCPGPWSSWGAASSDASTARCSRRWASRSPSSKGGRDSCRSSTKRSPNACAAPCTRWVSPFSLAARPRPSVASRTEVS